MPKLLVGLLAVALLACGGETEGTSRGEAGGASGAAGSAEQEAGSSGRESGSGEADAGEAGASSAGSSQGGMVAHAGGAGQSSLVDWYEVSRCGGFERDAGSCDWCGSGLEGGSTCDASVLYWSCAESNPGLKLQLTRQVFQCCAELVPFLVPSDGGYRLELVDRAQDQCNCLCVFDIELRVDSVPCDYALLTFGTSTLELMLSDTLGELVVSEEPVPVCADGSETSPEELLSTLGGSTGTYRVTREWNRDMDVDLEPNEIEFESVDDGPVYQVDFSADGREVTLTEELGTVFGGTLRSGEGVVYEFDLSYHIGGAFAINRVQGELRASLVGNGSGVPVLEANRGVLELSE